MTVCCCSPINIFMNSTSRGEWEATRRGPIVVLFYFCIVAIVVR